MLLGKIVKKEAHAARNDRTQNGTAILGLVAKVERTSELEAQDAFGPMTRQAIYDSPIAVLAWPMLQQIIEFNEKRAALNLPPVNPLDPMVDASIAKGVRDQAFTTILKDRSEQDARLAMKPIRRIARGRW